MIEKSDLPFEDCLKDIKPPEEVIPKLKDWFDNLPDEVEREDILNFFHSEDFPFWFMIFIILCKDF